MVIYLSYLEKILTQIYWLLWTCDYGDIHFCIMNLYCYILYVMIVTFLLYPFRPSDRHCDGSEPLHRLEKPTE